jgi:NAD(P)-dependent dehydrogenase (short-subunit alcohol dehydrogenase family)
MMAALITGASRGIGRATALHFAERGVELILLGRPSDAFVETEGLLKSMGARWNFHACDLRDRMAVDRVMLQLVEQGLVPDVVVFNAGVIERARVEEMSDESWDLQMEVNLTAPLRMTRALLPDMLSRDSGRILFVSSISAVVGTRAQAAYHASKAGLLGAMRCLAEELSDTGVSTMALLPGSVDTTMLEGTDFLPRMGPADVAVTLGFYGFDASSAHNGACVEMFGK